MVFLRLLTSSVIVLALARPRLRSRTIGDWRPVVALGIALGAMNWAFYESFSRIPLGVAVTIEFSGPLLVAAVGGRRRPRLGGGGAGGLGVALFCAGPAQGRGPRVGVAPL